MFTESVTTVSVNNEIRLAGGVPPVDFIIELEDRQTIHPSLFVTGAILAFAGIALAFSFLGFNIRFRKLRYKYCYIIWQRRRSFVITARLVILQWPTKILE